MPGKKTIAEKTDKRRRAKVKIGTDADGKPVYKYASGTNAKEMNASKKEITEKYITKTRAINESVIFGKYAQNWYDIYVKASKLKLSTKETYAGALNAHILPTLGDRQITAIKNSDIQKLLNNAGTTLSKSTCKIIRAVLTQIFRRALIDGITQNNQCIALNVTGAEEERRRPLTDAEKAVALQMIDAHDDGIMIALLYYTGMRIGEVMGLQWKDVDFKKREIHVGRALEFATNGIGTTKSASGVRTIPMTDQLVVILRKSPGIGDAFVVRGTRNRASYAKTRMEAVRADMIKINPSIARDKNDDSRAEITAHYFRHNYATILYYNGVDVTMAQKILGHSDIKTTMQFYVTLTETRFDADADRIRQAFSGNQMATK